MLNISFSDEFHHTVLWVAAAEVTSAPGGVMIDSF